MSDLFRMKKEDIPDNLAMKDSDVWDSLKHMELIVAIEETFDINMEDDEIVPENLDSIRNLMLFLKQKGVLVSLTGG